ncbi:MAG: class I SAM-dependent methyltransferase [Anaerolineae bacterium]|nr:class I SAM-dependent methyltransferase [Anaerolineae bacterium]
METEAYTELYEQEPDHWWYRGMREITRRMLTSLLSTSANLRILDAGCGVGGNLRLLKSWGKVYGLDYSALALDYALKAQSTQFGSLAQASVEYLPFADHTFDLVTSFDVLYSRDVANDSVAFSELARVLRPHGLLLIRLPALNILRGRHDEVVHGVRRYTAAELRRQLRTVGLSPQRVTYANSLLLPAIYLIRLLQRYSSEVTPSHSDVRPVPRLFNDLLYGLLRLEAAWIGSGHSFPAGVSVIAMANKRSKVN